MDAGGMFQVRRVKLLQRVFVTSSGENACCVPKNSWYGHAFNEMGCKWFIHTAITDAHEDLSNARGIKNKSFKPCLLPGSILVDCAVMPDSNFSGSSPELRGECFSLPGAWDVSSTAAAQPIKVAPLRLFWDLQRLLEGISKMMWAAVDWIILSVEPPHLDSGIPSVYLRPLITNRVLRTAELFKIKRLDLKCCHAQNRYLKVKYQWGSWCATLSRGFKRKLLWIWRRYSSLECQSIIQMLF